MSTYLTKMEKPTGNTDIFLPAIKKSSVVFSRFPVHAKYNPVAMEIEMATTNTT